MKVTLFGYDAARIGDAADEGNIVATFDDATSFEYDGGEYAAVVVKSGSKSRTWVGDTVNPGTWVGDTVNPGMREDDEGSAVIFTGFRIEAT